MVDEPPEGCVVAVVAGGAIVGVDWDPGADVVDEVDVEVVELLVEVVEPGSVVELADVAGIVEPAASADAGISTVGRITWLRTCVTAPQARPSATRVASNQPAANFNQLDTQTVSHRRVRKISPKG